MSTALDRYGGADAYARYDNELAEARERELRRGTCGRCSHSYTLESGGCVCLLDPFDPCEVDAGERVLDIGCEDYEER